MLHSFAVSHVFRKSVVLTSTLMQWPYDVNSIKVSISMLWKLHTCICILVHILCYLCSNILFTVIPVNGLRHLLWPHLFLTEEFCYQFQFSMNGFLKLVRTTSVSSWLSFHKLIVFSIPDSSRQEKDHYLLALHHIRLSEYQFPPLTVLCSQ